MRVRILAVSLWCAFAAQAHEIGTSRVSVTFSGRAYDVAIVTDATALAEKFQSLTGAPSVPASAPELEALLKNSDELFRRRVKLEFDGAAAHPAISYAVEPPIDAASAAAATIHLTGEVPDGGQHFTWSFGWTFATYALTAGGATQWIEGSDASPAMLITAEAPPLNRLRTAQRYLTLGFTHIVPYGFDHVLFVLGIYLLSRRAKSVLAQVSAFTVAHSITLGLSMYGIVSVSPRIVEPAIALSIAYVAIENVFLAELKSWRIALVFAFGLLHGMGFAGALKELGLPRAEFATALVAFNVGVEAGQLAVIAAAFALVGWHCAHRDWYRRRIVVPASAAIACTAVYWTLQRL